MKLEKEKILQEAFLLLNEVGLEKFNMRSLATRLSVSATAIYWHYKNKNELTEDMINQIYENAYQSTTECNTWQSHLVVLGDSLREELTKYRDSERLIASRAPKENAHLRINRERITESMMLDGLERDTSLQFVSIVISFVLGWMSYRQNDAYNKLLSSMFDFEAGFNIGLESLVIGFESLKESNRITVTPESHT